jgi:hypothetical protein
MKMTKMKTKTHTNCDVNCDHLHYNLMMEIMQNLFIHNLYVPHTNIMH